MNDKWAGYGLATMGMPPKKPKQTKTPYRSYWAATMLRFAMSLDDEAVNKALYDLGYHLRHNPKKKPPKPPIEPLFPSDTAFPASEV
jgi:hypothetical protein